MGRKPIPNNEKKMPSDYPQFAFRVSKEKKTALLKSIEAIQDTRNKHREDGDAYINKNDIIIEALEAGLKLIRNK